MTDASRYGLPAGVLVSPGHEVPENLPFAAYPARTPKRFGARVPAVLLVPGYFAEQHDKAGVFNPMPYKLAYEGWGHVVEGAAIAQLNPEVFAATKGWTVRIGEGEIEIGRPDLMFCRAPFLPLSDWVSSPPEMVTVLLPEYQVEVRTAFDVLSAIVDLTGSWAMMPLIMT